MAHIVLTFDNNKLASALYGQFDENLARLEQKLGVDIRSRGNQLTIKGSASAAEQARRALDNLYGILQKGVDIGQSDVDGAVRMADAIQKAARSRYGQETNIRADINPNTGEMKLQRLMEVVEKVDDYATQIAISSARERNPDAQLGDFIAEQLPPMDFGRIAAQSAKQVIVQKVREAERDRQYDEYKDRIGEIVNGTVKRVEYGNVIVDLGRGEAIIRRDELIPRENYKYGDRVRAYVYDVRREQRGPQIFLSRTHPQFMKVVDQATGKEIVRDKKAEGEEDAA